MAMEFEGGKGGRKKGYVGYEFVHHGEREGKKNQNRPGLEVGFIHAFATFCGGGGMIRKILVLASVTMFCPCVAMREIYV